MRDASAKQSLPPPLRLAIFQLVELRASHWCLPQDTTNYYTQRSQGNEILLENPPLLPSSDGDHLASDCTRNIAQEIIIRNSDSGKGEWPRSKEFHSGGLNPCCVFLVMGVHGRRVHLIETLSDTIISFKKVRYIRRSLYVFNLSLTMDSFCPHFVAQFE